MTQQQLHVRSSGRGRGPAVFVLHASGSSGRQWDALAAGLEARFHVHAVDLFGHGHSAPWQRDQPMTLKEEADTVASLLAGFPDGVHLVGHSYGGAVALRAALLLSATHPFLVRSLTMYEPVLLRLLLDTAPRQPAAQRACRVGASVRAWLARDRPDRAGRRFVDFWSGAGSWDALATHQQRSIAARMPSVLAHFDALTGDDLQRQQLAHLRMPVLCLRGEKTVATTRRIAELLRYLLPFAMHETLGGMGHLGPITHAAIVNARIAGFLDAELLLQQAREMTLAQLRQQDAWRKAA